MIYQFEIFRNLSFTEKRTLLLHLFYSFIEGLAFGVFALNEFIFIRSLKGTDFQLGILFLTMNIVLLFSIVLTEFLKRYKNKRKLLIYVAFVTRLPMLLFLLFPAELKALTSTEFYHILFIVIFFIFYMAKPVILPIINLYLKNNYKDQNFGKLFSYSTMINNATMILATFLFGLLMDHDYNWYRYAYPFLGILSIISIILLSFIRVDVVPEVIKVSLNNAIINSLKNSYYVLRSNNAFRDFEIGFMLYGFAWMICFTIVPKYYDEILLLNNTGVAFYKNFYYAIAIISLPFFGRYLGKMDPRKFAVMSFFFMLLTILFLTLTEYNPLYFEFKTIKLYPMLIISNIFYGLFAGSMPLLWGIGSSYFCKIEETADYQAIHLSLVGVRAGLAPILAIILLQTYNYTISYLFGMLILLIGISYMMYSHRIRSTNN
ncbi:MAG: MFS transporter [Bacteroidetes bacterium]|nr:MFS transporter [Bacteroidota bacterium]